jgi:ribonuclease-3
MGITRSEIENLVGFRIKNVDLYTRAFTHKSAKSVLDSYETLEFMGDSVLSFIVTKYLFDTYEQKQEGFLTKARTLIVRGKTLAGISERLGLGVFIDMDEKGLRNNWNSNPKILEDVYEALVGAVYLDLGMVYAKEFVLRTLDIDNIPLDDDNYKDQLMRWCQANKKSLPVYSFEMMKTGVFCVSVEVDGTVLASGFGKTKKDAEQNAAKCFFSCPIKDSQCV